MTSTERPDLAMRSPRPRSAILTLVLLLILPMAAALATATSGRIYKGSVAGVRICSESVIADVVDNKGYTTAWANTNCSTAQNQPSGHLGIRIIGLMDGGFCSSWTGYAYNSSSAWSMALGGKLCSNPSGSQAFQTMAQSRKWVASAGGYSTYSTVISPAQNY